MAEPDPLLEALRTLTGHPGAADLAAARPDAQPDRRGAPARAALRDDQQRLGHHRRRTMLRHRLGTACPPFLLVAGPIEWLGRPALGVVGSRDADEPVLEAARLSAELAVERGWAVVSGLARGVDQVAMAGALDGGGTVIGVPAEGISKVSRSAEIRRRVHAGELCIASPYAPDASFRAGNAMGRNKIVYALSQVTFVVASDEGTGGTWAGAKEALDRRYAPVAVWVGDGAKDGNHELVRRGASPISDLSDLFDVDVVTPIPAQGALF